MWQIQKNEDRDNVSDRLDSQRIELRWMQKHAAAQPKKKETGCGWYDEKAEEWETDASLLVFVCVGGESIC